MANRSLDSAKLRVYFWPPCPTSSFPEMTLNLLGSVHRKEVMYDGALDAFRKIYRSEGIRGLYRGVSFQVLRYSPASSDLFSLLDFIRSSHAILLLCQVGASDVVATCAL